MADPMLSWRRQWKPDLSATVWQTFVIKKARYLIKCHFSEESYEILIYDMNSMWHENCTSKRFKKRTKELNPSVEAPVTRLLDHLQSNLTCQQKDVKYDIDNEDDTMTITIQSNLAAGVPFTWKCHCYLATNDMMGIHLTTPLLTMIGELERRQEELESLLRKKDNEIEDYKLGGAKVSRKHLETVPFDRKGFLNEMNLSKGFESQVKTQGSSAFNQKGQDLYLNVMMKNAWLLRDRTEDIDDDDEEEEETTTAATQSASIGQRLPPSYIRGQVSPSTSPRKLSPRKQSSPHKVSSPESSPVKDTELIRRQALEKRLAAEESKLSTKKKKTKKGLF
ncbi:non-homologous end-joining factor 1-like [Glandiceps talaboti]